MSWQISSQYNKKMFLSWMFLKDFLYNGIYGLYVTAAESHVNFKFVIKVNLSK